MSELKPTPENLADPYVLQLIEALAKRDDRIEALETALAVCDVPVKRQRKEIERLRAERLAFATESEERQAEIERLCNIVETQEDALKEFHAEIERLRAVAHEAFYEAWDDAKHSQTIDVDIAWDRSDTKKRLEGDDDD